MYLYSIDLWNDVVFYPTRREAEREARRAHHGEIWRKRKEAPPWKGLKIEAPTITRCTVMEGLPKREMYMRLLDGGEWSSRMETLPSVRPSYTRAARLPGNRA